MTKQELEQELATANEKAAKLDALLASLSQRREQLVADYNAAYGGIQTIDVLLGDLK